MARRRALRPRAPGARGRPRARGLLRAADARRGASARRAPAGAHRRPRSACWRRRRSSRARRSRATRARSRGGCPPASGWRRGPTRARELRERARLRRPDRPARGAPPRARRARPRLRASRARGRAHASAPRTSATDGTLAVSLRAPRRRARRARPAFLLPGAEPAGAPVLSASEQLVHARVRAAERLDLASFVSADEPGRAALPSGERALQRARARRHLGGRRLSPRERGHASPRAALALGVRERTAAIAAIEAFLEKVRESWPVHRSAFSVGARERRLPARSQPAPGSRALLRGDRARARRRLESREPAQGARRRERRAGRRRGSRAGRARSSSISRACEEADAQLRARLPAGAAAAAAAAVSLAPARG